MTKTREDGLFFLLLLAALPRNHFTDSLEMSECSLAFPDYGSSSSNSNGLNCCRCCRLKRQRRVPHSFANGGKRNLGRGGGWFHREKFTFTFLRQTNERTWSARGSQEKKKNSFILHPYIVFVSLWVRSISNINIISSKTFSTTWRKPKLCFLLSDNGGKNESRWTLKQKDNEFPFLVAKVQQQK